jgi:hypothetical protein
MKATHAAPPCCHHPVQPAWRRPQRGEADWYLSHRVFDMNGTPYDEEGTDEGKWRVENVCGSLKHIEQAHNTVKVHSRRCAYL